MILALAAAVFSGCSASGPMFREVALQNQDSVVYVYRPSGSFRGSAVGLTIECDGKKLGYLWNKGYLYKLITPGHHVVSCSTEQKSEVPFEAKPGKAYYIEAEVELGYFIGRPKLIMVPNEKGKLAILGMRHSDSSK